MYREQYFFPCLRTEDELLPKAETLVGPSVLVVLKFTFKLN